MRQVTEWTTDMVKQLEAMKKDGCATAMIAQALNVPVQAVYSKTRDINKTLKANGEDKLPLPRKNGPAAPELKAMAERIKAEQEKKPEAAPVPMKPEPEAMKPKPDVDTELAMHADFSIKILRYDGPIGVHTTFVSGEYRYTIKFDKERT